MTLIQRASGSGSFVWPYDVKKYDIVDRTGVNAQQVSTLKSQASGDLYGQAGRKIGSAAVDRYTTKAGALMQIMMIDTVLSTVQSIIMSPTKNIMSAACMSTSSPTITCGIDHCSRALSRSCRMRARLLPEKCDKSL